MHDIIIDNISKSFGDIKVFDGFSAVLESGRIYRLTAPSGAGKTTLLRMLMRLEMPDGGYITGIPEDISAVFQEDRLLEQLSVYNNIAIAADMPMRREKAYIRCGMESNDAGMVNRQTAPAQQSETKGTDKLSRQQSESIVGHRGEHTGDAVMSALSMLGMAEYADKQAGELSGGMKRRTALIRAMMHRSELVLLDEPFTGLDDESRGKAAEYILGALNGRTCVIASHITEPGIEARSELIDI